MTSLKILFNDILININLNMISISFLCSFQKCKSLFCSLYFNTSDIVEVCHNRFSPQQSCLISKITCNTKALVQHCDCGSSYRNLIEFLLIDAIVFLHTHTFPNISRTASLSWSVTIFHNTFLPLILIVCWRPPTLRSVVILLTIQPHRLLHTVSSVSLLTISNRATLFRWNMHGFISMTHFKCFPQ